MVVAELFAALGLKVDQSSWDKGTKLIQGVGLALGAIAGVKAIEGIFDLVEGVGEAAIAAERLSQKLGISVEDVQRLGYAAKVSGVDAEQLQVGMQKLAKGLDEARTKGSGPVAESFSRIGLSMSDPLVKSKDLGETMLALAEKFKAMPDDATKTALAIEIFGRSGTALIPMLNQGKDGIVAFMQEADKLGIVIDQNTAKSFEELEHTQKRLSGTWQGIKNQIAVALLPALADIADSILAWTAANHDLIQSGIQTAVTALTYVFKGLALAVEAVLAVFDFFNEHTDLAKAVIIALGVVIAAFAIEAAAAWLVAFWPVALVAAIIAAIVLVVLDLWRSITTGKGVAADVFRWLKRVAQDWWEGLKDIGRAIGGFFEDVAKGIKDAFETAFNWVVDEAKKVGDALRNIPVLKQLGEGLGAAAGFLVTHATDDSAADGAYANAVAGGQFAGTEDEFNAQRAHTVSVPDRGAPASSPAADGSGPVTQIKVDMTVNPSAGMDEQELAAHVSTEFDKKMGQTLRDAHAATGGADQ